MKESIAERSKLATPDLNLVLSVNYHANKAITPHQFLFLGAKFIDKVVQNPTRRSLKEKR